MGETTNAGLIAKIKAGTATLAELQANAVQRGASAGITMAQAVLILAMAARILCYICCWSNASGYINGFQAAQQRVIRQAAFRQIRSGR